MTTCVIELWRPRASAANGLHCGKRSYQTSGSYSTHGRRAKRFALGHHALPMERRLSRMELSCRQMVTKRRGRGVATKGGPSEHMQPISNSSNRRAIELVRAGSKRALSDNPRLLRSKNSAPAIKYVGSGQHYHTDRGPRFCFQLSLFRLNNANQWHHSNFGHQEATAIRRQDSPEHPSASLFALVCPYGWQDAPIGRRSAAVSFSRLRQSLCDSDQGMSGRFFCILPMMT